MTIEQSIAARQIVNMIDAGYSKEAAITQVMTLLKSQGFGEAHAKKTAEEMAELV